MKNISKYSNSFTDTDLLNVYEKMLFIRKFEEKAAQLYTMQMIRGFCHLCIGQEAVSVGIGKAISGDDTVVTSYRCHGMMIAMGASPRSIMAELCGKIDGCSKGKGGSMHMFAADLGFYGGHGIVGAQVPIGTGLAFAHKYKNTKNISITIYGDGACNQGQVYEAFNMAKLWGLPALYIIENNEYSMGTSVQRSSSTEHLYKRGESFGIAGKRVDGMNFFEVFNAVKDAVATVRKESVPMLLEMKTYRYKGHSMSDPAKYRTKDEVELYKLKDPLKIVYDDNQIRWRGE